MPELTGTVTARSQYGIKVDDGDEWWNWSKSDFRGEPWEADNATKGKRIVATVDGKYIQTIKVLDDGAEPADLPYPADEHDTPVSEWGFEQKDRSILAQTCLKTAAFQWVESLRAAVELYKLAETKPAADELNAYAQAIMERKLPPIAEVLRKWALGALE